MNELINNKEIIGSGKNDLILRTKGRLYVQIGSVFTELNTNGNKPNPISISKTDDIIFLDSHNELNDIKYPGDNKIIVCYDKYIYASENNLYRLISKPEEINNNIYDKNGSIISNTVYYPPIICKSRKMVNNFNSELLNNFTSDNFLKSDVKTLTLDSIIVSNILNNQNEIIYDSNTDTLKVKNIITEHISDSRVVEYIEVESDIVLEVKDYSINNINNSKITLPIGIKSGSDISIYNSSINKLLINDVFLFYPGDFMKLKYIPINNIEYKWIKI